MPQMAPSWWTVYSVLLFGVFLVMNIYAHYSFPVKLGNLGTSLTSQSPSYHQSCSHVKKWLEDYLSS